LRFSSSAMPIGERALDEQRQDEDQEVVADGLLERRVGQRPRVVLEADEALGVGEVVPLERLRQVVEAVDAREHDRQDHEAEEQHEGRPDEQHDLGPLAARARARSPGLRGGGRARGNRGPGRLDDAGHG